MLGEPQLILLWLSDVDSWPCTLIWDFFFFLNLDRHDTTNRITSFFVMILFQVATWVNIWVRISCIQVSLATHLLLFYLSSLKNKTHLLWVEDSYLYYERIYIQCCQSAHEIFILPHIFILRTSCYFQIRWHHPGNHYLSPASLCLWYQAAFG